MVGQVGEMVFCWSVQYVEKPTIQEQVNVNVGPFELLTQDCVAQRRRDSDLVHTSFFEMKDDGGILLPLVSSCECSRHQLAASALLQFL